MFILQAPWAMAAKFQSLLITLRYISRLPEITIIKNRNKLMTQRMILHRKITNW